MIRQKRGSGAFVSALVDDISVDAVEVRVPAEGLLAGTTLRAIVAGDPGYAPTHSEALVACDNDDLPIAVLYNRIDPPEDGLAYFAAGEPAVVRIASVNGREIPWPSGQTAAQRKAAEASLRSHNIVCR